MKASGSAASLMQGVSQQVPQNRGPGQHTEQVNMLPDPVQGLSRRHGSRWVAETLLDSAHANLAAYIADTDNWRSFEYSNGGHDYVILYRAAARPVGSDLPPLMMYDKTDAVFLPYLRNVTDAQLDLLESGGISSMVAIGKYVFLSGLTTPATATSTNAWDDPANQQEAVVWIRGGAYAREFTVTATRTDDVQFTFSYKTPTSSYQGTLDTSNVPIYAADPAGGTQVDTEGLYIKDVSGAPTAALLFADWTPSSLSVKKGSTAMTNVSPSAPSSSTEYAWAAGAGIITFHSSNLLATDVTTTYTHIKTVTNPNYPNIVNEITNDFNTAVTNWIGYAADAIQPNQIAEELRLAAVAAGLVGATRDASTIIFSNVKALKVNDGGDGTLIRGVANEVTSIDQVSDIHKVGKVVKVRAKSSAEAFYLTAEAKDGTSTGYTEVTWVEGAGVVHNITGGLLYLTVDSGNACVASSSTLLAVIAAGTHPTYSPSTVGDSDSSPLPFFIGKQITYLGIFQDRLIVGAGAVVRCSKIGDYLNFFRSSILTAPADDPLEMLSQGSEDDVLRYSVMYDRDLVIFADRRQYAISGRVALTPTSANMQVMSAHSDAAQLPPRAVGGVIFYGQLGEKGSSVHQIQPGQVAESPESFIQSSQIDTYISGNIIELSSNAKPTHLIGRTTGRRGSLYVYTYLDKAQQGRVQDAWHRFDYDEALGSIVGMNATPAGLLTFFLRAGRTAAAPDVERLYLVADLQPFTTGLATYPYLDSLRTLDLVNGDTTSVQAGTAGPLRVAFDHTSEWQFVGSDLSDQAELLAEFPSATGPQVGYDQVASFTPTNPWVRDRNDKAITSGTLTVTKITVSLADSSGFHADVTSVGRETTETFEYNARIVGSPDDIAGRETITDIIQSQPIALETRDYTLTLRGRTWLPFTITTLEWVGQWFNRTQRF